MTKKNLILLAFLIIYFVWGSTYYAIKVAVEFIPPFAMMGIRFFLAGILMLSWGGFSNLRQLSWRSYRDATVLAVTMVVCGTGVVGWVEVYLPSGLTALLISMTPVWLIVMDACLKQGQIPGFKGILGALLGLAGSLILVGFDGLSGSGQWGAVMVLVASTLMWACGSLYARYHKHETSPFLQVGMQLWIGGVVLGLIAAWRGEWAVIEWSAIPPQAWIGWAYLVIFGSILVFPAYIWLMQVSTPSRVATHSFVNPAVAVLIGWGIGGEQLTLSMALAALIIVLGVALITFDKGSKESDQVSQAQDCAV